MTKSCKIASDAIATTMKSSHLGVTEHQLFARVDYECRMNGAEFLAYPPVVASGDRANVIHYINNNQMVGKGDTILMDAGEQHNISLLVKLLLLLECNDVVPWTILLLNIL